jgi:hypothetical protein
MAHRQFTDARGAEWLVYDVNPRSDDRRTETRRRGESAGSDPADRRGDDRRLTVSGSRPVRLTQGWLCFDREDERRRFQPIPTDWHLLPDSELSQLLDQARPAPVRKHANKRAGGSRP